MCHISGFICSGFICSDRTFRLVYSDSNLIVIHISLSLHFRTYVSFIVSGYSYYINMFVTWGGSRGGSRGPRTPPGPQRGGPGPLFQNEENSIYYLQFYLIPPNKSL